MRGVRVRDYCADVDFLHLKELLQVADEGFRLEALRGKSKFLVAVETSEGESGSRLVGYLSAHVESKFIHGCRNVCHVMDIVCSLEDEADKSYVKNSLLDAIVSWSKTENCYKVIAIDLTKNPDYINTLGFIQKNVHMELVTKDLDDGEKFVLMSFDPKLKVRRLLERDYDSGFLELLSELSTVNNISSQSFLQTLQNSRENGPSEIIVIEDETCGRVISAATLFLSKRFDHDSKAWIRTGLVEDIVVGSQYRGKKLSKVLLGSLFQIAIENDCQKIGLDCDEDLCSMYLKFGFQQEGFQLSHYIF